MCIKRKYPKKIMTNLPTVEGGMEYSDEAKALFRVRVKRSFKRLKDKMNQDPALRHRVLSLIKKHDII